MRSPGQSRSGKFAKGAEKGRFGRQLLEHRKTADAAQRTIYREPLMLQGARLLKPRHGLGQEGVRQLRPLVRRATRARVPERTEFLDARPFQRVDKTLQFRRQFDFVPQLREQLVLDDAPTLRQGFLSGSMQRQAS
jgi:hypothetical protein